jgi:predicted amidohydrolase YtcJ
MSFSWGKGDMFVERLGERVLPAPDPAPSLLDAGHDRRVRHRLGDRRTSSSTSRLGPHPPLLRQRPDEPRPAQAVTRAEALAMWTRDAARVLRWDDIGTLAPGAHADLVVVDRDPLTCAVEALPGTQVLRTMVAGRVVHDTGAL